MDKMKTSNAALLNGLDRIQNLIPTKPTEIKKPDASDGQVSFKDTLGDALKTQDAKAPVAQPIAQQNKAEAPQLKFSNHAIERMNSRGISYSPEDLTRLGEAVQKAAAKGSKDTLVLMDSSALIVSVKNNTVVTVMDKNALKENVFTNIDSTIVM
jgi:flagellar operon protein